MTKINIPISIGELFDKITILRIKKLKILDEEKLLNVNKELAELERILSENGIKKNSLYEGFMFSLYEANNALWNIEEQIRKFESNGRFDELFIDAARKVYQFNDIRFGIKKQINMHYKSEIREEKSYCQ